MKKTILTLLLAAFCATSCKDTFMFDNMYEDERVFDLKVRIDSPKDITSSEATIPVTILTDETIVSRGIALSDEPHSSVMTPFPSASQDKQFEMVLEYLSPGTTYYVRGFCIDKSGSTYYSLEKSFTTK